MKRQVNMRCLLFLSILFWLNNSCEVNAQVIRAKCVNAERFVKKWRPLENKLRQCGFVFVDKNPDIVFCSEVTPKVLAENKPIIVLERWSSATLKGNSRDYLGYDKVIAVFKNRDFKDNQDHNKLKLCCRRYHYTLMSQEGFDGGYYPSPLSNKQLKKVYCVPWEFDKSNFSPHYKSLKKFDIDFDQNRPVDLFFAGCINQSRPTEESVKWYRLHRERSIEAMRKIKGINSKILVGKVLPYPQYIKESRRAKVVVSPWGLGEWCHRDCEAMLCGAVLVKPDTEFVRTVPEIYLNNVLYVPCSPDFSDLEEIVTYIVNNFDEFRHMREKARDKLCKQTGTDTLVEYFVSCVKNALNQRIE